MSWKNTPLFQTALCVLAKVLMSSVGQIIHLCVCVWDMGGGGCGVRRQGQETPLDTPHTHTHPLTKLCRHGCCFQGNCPKSKGGVGAAGVSRLYMCVCVSMVEKRVCVFILNKSHSSLWGQDGTQKISKNSVHVWFKEVESRPRNRVCVCGS